MVPGIAPSADPGRLLHWTIPYISQEMSLKWYLVLQARMFAYPDAARYRLGVNYQQLPTNAPKAPVYCPFERDGTMDFSENYGFDPNYVGSSLKPTKFYQDIKGTGPKSISTLTEHEKWVGEVVNFQTTVTDDDFVQPAGLWAVIKKDPGQQERFYGNVAVHLCQVKSPKLRNDVYGTYMDGCSYCSVFPAEANSSV